MFCIDILFFVTYYTKQVINDDVKNENYISIRCTAIDMN